MDWLLFLDCVLDECFDEFVVVLEFLFLEEGFEFVVEVVSEFFVGFDCPVYGLGVGLLLVEGL